MEALIITDDYYIKEFRGGGDHGAKSKKSKESD